MTRVVFDNTDLSKFGYTFHKDIDEVPEHDYEEVTILGKNGTLLIDNKRMKNVSESYDIAITDNSTADLDKLRNFLASKVGFKRLEDDIRPERFVMAKFNGFSSRLPSDRSKATATMNFERKPERWLKIGEEAIDMSDNAHIFNPTLFESKPIIRVYGTGTVNVNDKYFTVAENSFEYIDIDCETMDCSSDLSNANQYVTFNTTDFITLSSGNNTIVYEGNVTKIEITPRWYEI